MEFSSLLTLADWHGAYGSGASPRTLLEARRRRLATESPIAAWIARTDEAHLAVQIAALEARAEKHGDRGAAMRALPFFGGECRCGAAIARRRRRSCGPASSPARR
jgi:hypothetical protein